MRAIEPERRTEELELSPFQLRALAAPADCDLFLGGGRGGGKSFTLAVLALRHCEQYGARSRVLYVRQSYPGVSDFELLTRELFAKVYGSAARYNGSAHCWRLPGGGYFELGQLEDPGDYPKYQGRSFSLLLVDEAAQWSDAGLLDMLRSNLRGPSGVPVRVVMAANPGGPGHAWIAQRYVFRGAPWQPFVEPQSGRTWIYAPSTLADNFAIDQDGYRRQLEAACASDPELLASWLTGNWAIARGAYFAGVLAEGRNAIAPWRPPTDPELDPSERWWWQAAEDRGWDFELAHDFGASAPSVTFVAARSNGGEGPDGRFYPRESVLLLDELATNEPGSLTRGLGWTVPVLAEEIRALAARWETPAAGCADDAIFAKSGSGAGSIAEEFARARVRFRPARKADRRTGWELMRRLLQAAGKPDVPGLYVSRGCSYFWQTVPYLGRDPRRVDDVDSRGADHAADAARYAVTGRRGQELHVHPFPFSLGLGRSWASE